MQHAVLALPVATSTGARRWQRSLIIPAESGLALSILPAAPPATASVPTRTPPRSNALSRSGRDWPASPEGIGAAPGQTLEHSIPSPHGPHRATSPAIDAVEQSQAADGEAGGSRGRR